MLRLSLYLFLLFLFPLSSASPAADELQLLLQVKAALDPENLFLTSWPPAADPCSAASFDGIACNEYGHVTNISLQGKGLPGKIPPAIGGLKSLTGLYLHFNALSGRIPKEIAALTNLTDLYLNVNNLSGEIPHQMGNLTNLRVLQLCYNKLSGGIPTQVGSLRNLSVLALQYNNLTGAIPASLGDLGVLTRLDLSFNGLFGPVPVKVASVPLLEVLDIRNNSLSGNVPPALKRLKSGFQYANNPSLCGVGFSNLKECASPNKVFMDRPQPIKPNGLNKTDIPESTNLQPTCPGNQCSSSSKNSHTGVILGIVGSIAAFTFIGLFTYVWYRRRKQKIGSAFESSDSRLSTDQAKEVYKGRASPLISLEYSNGWDPLAKGQITASEFSQEFLESYMFNLEEVERATQCFSDVNLLGKSSFLTVYKGFLRDRSVVVKCIAKASCKYDEDEFLKGLKILISLNHENLVRLRGFCCSRGRGECFLIYDYVPNGNLLQYLDANPASGEVLQWSTRILILYGIAKGLGYLHGSKGKKPAIVHQNVSAENVLIDKSFNPLLAGSCLHKLLADDIVFSTLKASAAMGYLAPEYTTTGRFTEKSDVYAFGIIAFQILSGKSKITQSVRHKAELSGLEDFVDINLKGKVSTSDAIKLGKIAVLCIDESPSHRPSMESVIQQLGSLCAAS